MMKGVGGARGKEVGGSSLNQKERKEKGSY